MKLLLTSAGVTNETIGNGLDELLAKPSSEVRAAIIPTAANVEPGHKGWFIDENFHSLQNRRYGFVDIVDPSAAGVDWRGRLANIDLLYFSGGNTFHLLDQLRKTGMDMWIREHVNDKVYAGVSAGSIVMGQTIDVATIEPADPNTAGITDLRGLGLVDFDLEPHCDEKRFALLEEWTNKNKHSLYALDDSSAVKVVGDKIEIISEGTWKRFN